MEHCETTLLTFCVTDTVMAEYITIMLINQKTKGMGEDTRVSICKPTCLVTDQVTSELTERKSMGYLLDSFLTFLAP